MRITLDNAEKITEYIQFHVSKAHNVPMLRDSLMDSLRLLEKYAKNEYPIVTVKLK